MADIGFDGTADLELAKLGSIARLKGSVHVEWIRRSTSRSERGADCIGLNRVSYSSARSLCLSDHCRQVLQSGSHRVLRNIVLVQDRDQLSRKSVL